MPGGRIVALWQGPPGAADVGIEISHVELDQNAARRAGTPRPIIVFAGADESIILCGPVRDAGGGKGVPKRGLPVLRRGRAPARRTARARCAARRHGRSGPSPRGGRDVVGQPFRGAALERRASFSFAAKRRARRPRRPRGAAPRLRPRGRRTARIPAASTRPHGASSPCVGRTSARGPPTRRALPDSR